MNIELSDEEARGLASALDIRLLEMRSELAHTDDHAYKNDLRRSRDLLQAVAQRLDRLLVTEKAA
jgi:hypothetical protein